MKSKSSLLLLCLLVSCGGGGGGQTQIEQKTSTSAPSPLEKKDENKTPAPVAVPTELSGKIGQITENINSKKIEQKEGLSQISQVLDENLGDNWWETDMDSASSNATQTSTSKDLEIEEIAKKLVGIRGDSIDNLIAILNLETSLLESGDSADRLERLLGVFQLLKADTAKPLSMAMDRLLAQYLILAKYGFEENNSKGIGTNQAVDYFKSKIEYHHKNKVAKEELFKRYSILASIFTPPQLYLIFNKIVPGLTVQKNDSLMAHRLFQGLLTEIIENPSLRTAKTIDKALLASAANHAQRAIENLALEGNYTEAFTAVDAYFILFDIAAVDSGLNKADWIAAVDLRSNDVAWSYQQTVKERLSKNGPEEIRRNPSHPYQRLYLNRALLESNQGTEKLLDAKELDSLDLYQKKFYSQINELGKIDLLASGAPGKYLKNYYGVETARHFNEYQTSVHGPVKKNDDDSARAYEKQTADLVSALNYRYNKSFDFSALRKRDTVFDLHDEIKSEYLDVQSSGLKKNYCTGTGVCQDVLLEAGIYQSSFTDGVNEFFGAKIRFTPLAMLYMPGQKLVLNFHSIENAWIDVSGLNEETVIVPEKDNLGKWPLVKVSAAQTKLAGQNYKVVRTHSLATAYQGPQGQPTATAGRISGKIEIHQNNGDKIKGLPLFVSRGGNGGDGAKGLSAPRPNANGGCVKEYDYRLGEDEDYVVPGSPGTMWSDLYRKTCVGKLQQFTVGVWNFNHDVPAKLMHCTQDRTQVQRGTVKAGRPGDGGNAGASNLTIFHVAEKSKFLHLLSNQIVHPGVPGKDGKVGECGDGNDKDQVAKGGELAKIIGKADE